MTKKLGFWATLGIVIGSQIGSGVFMLPSVLAPYGLWGAVGWLISGTGAISLALVFATLCRWYPQTGGAPIYVREAFGPTLAFFTGWTYWIISWVSSTAVIVATMGYLLPLVGSLSSWETFACELLLLGMVTACNLRSVEFASRIEVILTFLKVVPLLVFPIAAFLFFKKTNLATVDFTQLPSIWDQSRLLSTVTLLTLWGFIGLEAAATPAGEVHNPQTTIPKAIIWGTCLVAFLYLINSVSIMGVVPATKLSHSGAPYVEAARHLFGGEFSVVVSLIGAIICIGTLNAWILASGQIALGLAQDNLMPALFKKTTKKGSPVAALLISSTGMVPFLLLMMEKHISEQIFLIIDYSVISFLFVYALSVLSFFKLAHLKRKKGTFILNQKGSLLLGCGGVSLLFCVWIIIQVPLSTLMGASVFTLSGIFVYLWETKRKQRNT